MGILIGPDTRVLVSGITGTYARRLLPQMLRYGTQVVGGAVPGKGGEIVDSVVVFDSVSEAVDAVQPNAALVAVPAERVRQATEDVIRARIPFVVVLAEGVPIHDTMHLRALCERHGVWGLGPNTGGLMTAGECLMGAGVPSLARPGSVGLLSRSGTLRNRVLRLLYDRGLGVSTAAAIGGDPVILTNMVEYVRRFAADPRTRVIVLIGEIGGSAELEVAAELPRLGKPLVAYIVGRAAPPEQTMGHAGAIIRTASETAEHKMRVLAEAGARVARTLWDIPDLVEECLPA